MPFPEKMAHWIQRAGGNKCQVVFWDEKRDQWKQCGNESEHSHHVIPESALLYEGKDPNNSDGIGACKFHHVGPGNADDNTPFTGDFSFHPDMGQALIEYRAGDKESFKKAAKKHIEAVKKGEHFWGGDEQTDGYYLDHARQMVYQYSMDHPEDPKPTTREHPKRTHKHWADIYFGKRSYPEDEEENGD